MNRRLVILLVLAVVLLGGIVVALVVFHEPSHEGRRISAWLDDFIESDSSLSPPRPPPRRLPDFVKRAETFKALQTMGVEGVPYILRRVGQGESGWQKKYAEVRPKMPNWLQRILPQSKDPLNPEGAAAILHSIGPAALPQSIEALKSPNSLVREAAAIAINSLVHSTNKPIYAIPVLTVAACDSDARVRMYAAGALGSIGPEAVSAVPALTAALQGNDLAPNRERTYARAWAATALGKIGPAAKSASPALRSLLTDADGYLRAQAALAICRIDGDVDVTLPLLMAELSKTEYKWACVDALGEMGPRAKKAFPVLVKHLRHAEPIVRESITKALFKIDPDAVSKLDPRVLGYPPY